MSIFDDDGMSAILHDELNENVIGNELPSGSEDEEKADDGEQAPIKVEPKKRSVRNPRPRLTIDLLKGPRGIHTIENYFKDMKFAGKGHENRDLNEIMKRLQHWGHRMYPNYKFDDVLLHIERLSKKKPLQIHMNNYRRDLLKTETDNKDLDAGDDEMNDANEEPFDEFDALIGEQIAISKLAGATPKTPYSVRSDYTVNTSAFATPRLQHGSAAASTPYQFGTPPSVAHRNTGSPEPHMISGIIPNQITTTGTELEIDGNSMPVKPQLTSEQLALIAENRRKAQERFRQRAAAKVQASSSGLTTVQTTDHPPNHTD